MALAVHTIFNGIFQIQKHHFFFGGGGGQGGNNKIEVDVGNQK